MVGPLLLLLTLGAPAPGVRPLPTLLRAPAVDGALKDLDGAERLPVADGAADLTLRAAYRARTLYLGVELDAASGPLDVSLFFPGAGVLAKGAVLRLTPAGLAPPLPEVGPPAWAQALIRAAVKAPGRSFTAELAIPAAALPRFPATGPLLVSVCVEGYRGEERWSSCQGGDMPGGPVRIPDDLRKAVDVAPPAQVETLEGRPRGWVGFETLPSARWALGDAELGRDALVELVADADAVNPAAVALAIPERLTLPDNRTVYAVLTGKNPYAVEGRCDDAAELRLKLYAVSGRSAVRVLDWPASTCKLGRAMRVELSSEGGLTIGYTGGTTAHFTFIDEHFERSELGARPLLLDSTPS